MRRHAAIFTLGCVFLAGCQSAHSTPAPTAKPVTVTVTTTATRTVTISVTPSASATASTTTVPRTQEAGGSLEDSEPYDGYSYEDDYEDDYDSGVGGYYRSEPKLFMHRNPGNNVAPKIPSQKRYNSTPNIVVAVKTVVALVAVEAAAEVGAGDDNPPATVRH